MPVFSERFTPTQIERIKQRWEDLRYVRIDLWRQLADRYPTVVDRNDPEVVRACLDWVLTQKSLEMLQGHVAAIVIPEPDYYRQAIRDQALSEEERIDSLAQARTDDRDLTRQYSRGFWQSEYLAFVLTALLETAESAQGHGDAVEEETAGPQR